MFVPLHWFIDFPERVFRRVSLKPFHERSFSLHSHLFLLVFCSKRELLKSEGFRSISFDVICFLILLMFLPACTSTGFRDKYKRKMLCSSVVVVV